MESNNEYETHLHVKDAEISNSNWNRAIESPVFDLNFGKRN